MQSRTNTRASRTQVQQEPVRVLHLRPSAPGTEEQSSHTPRSTPRVRWTEDVVDNEDMGKKKSKICCIFHPQREFGESSDESSSSSSDSSDDSDKEESKEPTKECCNHKHKKEKSRKAGPNAYEKQPHYKNKRTVPKE